MLRDRQVMNEAEIILPGGELVTFRLHNPVLESDSASCSVIKDAGDDPDVTNGAEIRVTIFMEPSFSLHKREIIISGGTGIGRVTKPGLAVPVGEWAINPVPRKMIRLAINEIFAVRCVASLFKVTVSIPTGEELAKKTLNARLGIIGGLSILGTTGIVRPVSAKAWTDTIDAAVDVALASGSDTVVLSTGRSSEETAQRHLGKQKRLPEEAFVMMGDHVGYALRTCSAKKVGTIVIAAQFAKLLKIACGHEQTHVSSSSLDLEVLASWIEGDNVARGAVHLVKGANTARQVLEASGNNEALITLVCSRVGEFASRLAPNATIKVLLAGYGQEVLYFG
jgi:cobalt-precorrin-5B (C1)-methyltransferase